MEDRAHRHVMLGALDMTVDADGGLWIAAERTLVVSDLHLEKGSSFAMRGSLVPPYDTGATLAAVTAMIGRWSPRRVIALGDSFHDDGGFKRLSERDASALASLQAGRDWLWITGNHDPSPPAGLPGEVADEIVVGGVAFRHAPVLSNDAPQIAGHLHPCVVVRGGARGVRRRCFAVDQRTLVMPALGAYSGGLDLLYHRAFRGLFDEDNLVAHVMGDGGLFSFPATTLRG
ncbi:ligase-associated DNA damage response endonuclease PdeM [Terrarubrum flagellatum]|uniref:ligase-associated DNA damage response endonuclease PdeM n=1 Tax=Terrirubrum flagellatum TaxID=2895980 RepID=UPI0031452C85